ncbi:hypothetical protein [Terriglobus roseus]|uniref:Uncharacterized protein n=1 Tax=Terriglobus roseus TaxID=392734 RepID=A0A1G7JJ26_9BACT|nr:hypothetical protein [Terriglobus roseus]SDF24893.1 hypothetical protein SAMN05444167_1838 [Terriglobus roseus]
MRSTAITLFLLCAPVLGAQTALPATSPTQSVSDLPSAHPNAVAAVAGAETKVTWNGSLLTVEASGEAMPELLGRVARETGMKITGGVPDERIYGKYGPAPVQTVLAQLFDGLSINMMLVNETATKPKELLLTARTGAATPPSIRQVVPDYPQYRPRQAQTPPPPMPPANPTRPPQQTPPTQHAEQSPTNGSQQAFPSLAPPPAENTAFTNNGNTDTTSSNTTNNGSSTTNGSTPDSSQSQSSSGMKTPEQIFEELRKRQQQQQNPQ